MLYLNEIIYILMKIFLKNIMEIIDKEAPPAYTLTIIDRNDARLGGIL